MTFLNKIFFALYIHPVGFLRAHITALNYDIPLCCIWQPYALGYPQLCRRMTPMRGVILRQFFCVLPAFIIYCLFTQADADSYLYSLHIRWCGSLPLALVWHSVSKELFILQWRQKVKRLCWFPREMPYYNPLPNLQKLGPLLWWGLSDTLWWEKGSTDLIPLIWTLLTPSGLSDQHKWRSWGMRLPIPASKVEIPRDDVGRKGTAVSKLEEGSDLSGISDLTASL